MLLSLFGNLCAVGAAAVGGAPRAAPPCGARRRPAPEGAHASAAAHAVPGGDRYRPLGWRARGQRREGGGALIPSPAPRGDRGAAGEALRSEVLKCTRCPFAHINAHTGGFLRRGAQPRRLAGDPARRPGAEEDRARRAVRGCGPASCWMPCCAPSVSIAGPTSYIANVLKRPAPWEPRPPDPRKWRRACRNLVRQIRALCSRRSCSRSGRIAAQNLLATGVPLGRLAGPGCIVFGELNTPAGGGTYHPAYLLRHARPTSARHGKT